jgi:acyl carrier protein
MKQDSIAGEVSRELGRLLSLRPEHVEMSRSLGEMGLDSLGYVEFADFVNKRFGIPLTPDVLFEHDTIARTIAHIRLALSVSQEA